MEWMRKTLLSDLKDHNIADGFILGYFEPGHSFKGKQLPLTSDEDLSKMYFEHHKRRSINLWIKSAQVVRQTKRLRCNSDDPFDDSRPAKKGVYSSHLQKMDELEEILDKLASKHHESKFTPEQLHCWANLIQMKKHSSYEFPPDKPFFGKQANSSLVNSSPGKRIQLRTQCIDQLTKWHRLLENRVISEEEYEEMHKTIMTDIKKF